MLLYYELKEKVVMTNRQSKHAVGQFGADWMLQELTAALLIRGVGAVDDLVAPGGAGYAAPILARRFRRAARDVCGEGGEVGGYLHFKKIMEAALAGSRSHGSEQCLEPLSGEG